MNSYSSLILIDSEDVIRIHDMIINRFGGLVGIQNLGLLDSAVNHIFMIFEFGKKSEQEIYHLNEKEIADFFKKTIKKLSK